MCVGDHSGDHSRWCPPSLQPLRALSTERASLASLCPDTTGGALPARTFPCSLLASREAFWEGSLLLYRLAGGAQSYGPSWLFRYLRVSIPYFPLRHPSSLCEVGWPVA